MSVANAVSNVAWIPQGGLGEEDWLATGRRFGTIGRGSPWWLADWARHGSERWGDRFTEAARATGLERGTLRSMAWVAAKVDPSVRNENLSWEHHVAVASLDREDQRYWLERAELEGLSDADLRNELRARRQGEAGGPTAHGAEDAQDGGGAVCPTCGHRATAG